MGVPALRVMYPHFGDPASQQSDYQLDLDAENNVGWQSLARKSSATLSSHEVAEKEVKELLATRSRQGGSATWGR